MTVTAVQLTHFQGTGAGEAVQGLVFRGGLELHSPSDVFGGLSAIGFVGGEGRLVMVSDRGNFVSGQLIYDEGGAPLSVVGVDIAPIQNSKGADLPRAFARDAEALAVIERPNGGSVVRVGFENLTRVADFHLEDAVPTGPALDVIIPDWLTQTRTNQSLEAVCVAPPASPIAGSTLLLTEGVIDNDGAHSGWLLGKNDKGPLSYRSGSATDPTDCAFLPNGDLLVLERGVVLVNFAARLVRIKAADVKPGSEMTGEVLFEGAGGDLDNMEGLAVHQTAAGETRVTLVSDNNFNDWERTLLLEFTLKQP
ncbi:MAG TPA: esterase-like activity of phytase family protein [Devosia sp.]|nr:esterase-like activity of phytase family protein [Devosia sp.]